MGTTEREVTGQSKSEGVDDAAHARFTRPLFSPARITWLHERA